MSVPSANARRCPSADHAGLVPRPNTSPLELLTFSSRQGFGSPHTVVTRRNAMLPFGPGNAACDDAATNSGTDATIAATTALRITPRASPYHRHQGAYRLSAPDGPLG